MSYILLLLYLAVILYIVGKAKFFSIDSLSRKSLILLFVLKFVFGTALLLIYTHHYTLKETSDVHKFFVDGVTLNNIFSQNPLHYFQLLFGINTDADYLQKYILGFNYWFLEDGSRVYNDTRTVIRFNSIAYFFSRGNMHIHTLFVCFLSFSGLVAIYKTVEKQFIDRKKLLLFAVFLVPGVLFWGSGILKEGIVLFTMGFLIYFYFKLIKNLNSFKYIFLFLLFCYFVMLSKFYIVFAIMPAIGAGLLSKIPKLKNSNPVYTYLLATLIFLAGALIADYSNIYKPFAMLSKKEKDFKNVAWGGVFMDRTTIGDSIRINLENKNILVEQENGLFTLPKGSKYNRFANGRIVDSLIAPNDFKDLNVFITLVPSNSRINIPNLEPNIFSVIKNAPVALFNSIFRPFIWEAKNILSLIAAGENLLFLLAIALSLLFFKIPVKNNLDVWFFCLSFSSILFILIGLTTPVIGAIVRYKIPALPFFLMFVFLTFDMEKIKTKFPFIYKWFN
ncbi:MAG: hypothetical protein V4667_09755 [Bacteroidota bacterium]